MRKRLILAAITVLDAWIVFKGSLKVFFAAIKNNGGGLHLHPWGMARMTAQTMWDAHRLKMVALKYGALVKPAEGEYLDNLARDWGIKRNGRTDEELRTAITKKRAQLLERMQ